jgi:hypothetical protein
MWYVLASVAAASLIGGAILYIRQTDGVLKQALRQSLLKQQQAGTLPPELQGLDLQTVDLGKFGDFQMQLPAAVETRLKLSYLLADYWYVWGPMVVVLCFGMAALFGSVTRPEK